MSNLSLAEMLQQRSPTEKPLQLEILRQVAAQLDQAHQRNLTHGNLSPQSILVSELGAGGAVSVFVKDFGSTFDIDPGAMGGAPPVHAYYLSPEQVLGIDVSPSSDEFSLAVIAYEMISGGLPFSASKLSGLIFAICSDPPRPIYEFNSSLSAAVQNVFNRALAKERENRYTSCWAFVTALLAELGESESGGQAREAGSEGVPIAAAAAVRAAAPEPELSHPISASGIFAPPEPETPPAAPPSPIWNGTPVFAPSAAPIRTEMDLPSMRRRNRYEDQDEPKPAGSPLKKFAIIGLLLFALAGVAAYFFNGPRTPNLPTQVLETKNAPLTPAPTDNAAKSEALAAKANAPERTVPPPPPQSAPANPSPSSSASAQNTRPAAVAPSGRSPAAVPQAAAPGTSQEPNTAASPARTQRSAALASQREQSPGLVDVELLSEPPGANVVIDGNPALTCKAPCNISLSEGRHTLSANLPGYTLAQRIFNVPETSSVFLTMPRLTGALVVTSNPAAATILIDGKDYGLTPATLHLPPGQHQVTLMNGSQRHDVTVSVVADGIQATGYTFPR